MLDTRTKIEARALTCAALFLTAASATLAAQEAPPGLVPVEGGRVKLGTDVKDVEALILQNEDMANVLVSETPQVQEKVDDFFLMPTEVTNEQYAVFVGIAGIRPPVIWADEEALSAARTAFLEEQGKAAAEARAKGQRIETRKFEPEEWWKEAWETTEWSVPQALAQHPATYVDYASALAYATWAGLRLPTEAEWTCAARGESDAVFPWGDAWEAATLANTVEQPTAETRPVGSFPDAARNGVYDLAGNVWEWTASPYTAFDGYRTLSIKVGSGRRSRTIEALAAWEPAYRVLKGGAFPNTLLAARVATRMGADKSQSTAGLGFRCAASAKPGADVAQAVVANDVLMSALPAGVSFDPPHAMILQRWESEPGKAAERIDGYRVITAHQRIVFVPTEQIEESSSKNLDTTSLTEPVVIGVFSTSLPTAAPQLDAGTYVVAYRAAGELPKQVAAGEAGGESGEIEEVEAKPSTLRFTEAPGFDPEVAQFLLFDGQANPLAAIPATGPGYEKRREGQVSLEPFTPPKRIDPDNPPPQLDTVHFRPLIGGKSSSKGFAFTVDFKYEKGAIDDTWK